ncbi:MAG: hypothetical protein GX483_05960 [Actinomycetaceae bacterium]|nr:hypothetical protein [Actinomycetaceae bacterium]
MPVATNEDEIDAIGDPVIGLDIHVVTLTNIDELFRAAPYIDALLINPGTQQFMVDREIITDIARFRDGKITRRPASPDTEITVDNPTVYPDALAEALSAEARNHRLIRQMWMRELREDEVPASYLVIVKVPEEEFDDASADLAKAAATVEGLALPVEFRLFLSNVQYPGHSDPFYKRKLFGRS